MTFLCGFTKSVVLDDFGKGSHLFTKQRADKGECFIFEFVIASLSFATFRDKAEKNVTDKTPQRIQI